ncbi:unnamed protein product, partial [Staurois parvus]
MYASHCCLLTLLVCSIFCHRLLADYGASHCCCQPLNLPWAPVTASSAAARSTVSHGSLYGLPLLLSPSRHSAMCHFQVSSHCWCVPFFCHRVLADYGPPIASCQAPNLPWAPVPPPHAAAKVHISHGSLYGPIASMFHRHTCCHVPLSGLPHTLLVCSIFCHRC